MKQIRAFQNFMKLVLEAITSNMVAKHDFKPEALAAAGLADSCAAHFLDIGDGVPRKVPRQFGSMEARIHDFLHGNGLMY